MIACCIVVMMIWKLMILINKSDSLEIIEYYHYDVMGCADSKRFTFEYILMFIFDDVWVFFIFK